MQGRPLAAIGVIGPGLMGLGIARVAARGGVPVTLVGRDAASAAAAVQRLRDTLQRDVARSRLAAAAAAQQIAQVRAGAGVGDLAGCDLVVESVPESRDQKRPVLAGAQSVLSAGAILATNTSGLPVTGLADGLPRPERFVGLHFFSPVDRMRLVEVVRGAATDAVVVEQAMAWMRQLGQEPVLVRDGPGFFTSRVFAAYLDEAIAMVAEGLAAPAIDAAAVGLGRAVGPLALLDDIGLALNLQQVRQARADGLPERFCRPLAQPVLEWLVGSGRAGRRAGGGFYDVDAEGRRTPWPGLAARFGAPAAAVSSGAMQQRLRWAEVLEAMRCLEEGVVTSADDADTASVLGLGFPATQGGVLRWAETQGLDLAVQACAALARAHGARFEPSPWLRALAAGGQGLSRHRREPAASTDSPTPKGPMT